MGIVKWAISLANPDPEEPGPQIVSTKPVSLSLSNGRGIEEDPDNAGLVRVTINGQPTAMRLPKRDLPDDELQTFYEAELDKFTPEAVTPAIPTPSLPKPETPVPMGGVTPEVPGTELPGLGAKLKEEIVNTPENGQKTQPKASLAIHYVQGPSFDRSYFVAKQGDQVKIVHASRVIPTEVQELIVSGKETTVTSPEEVISQIRALAADTMEGFVKWADSLPKLSKEALAKSAAEWSRAEGEIQEPPMPKDNQAFKSVDTGEWGEGEKLSPPPTGAPKSLIPKYFGRLPGQSQPEAYKAMNPQSKLLQRKYELLKEALADAEEGKKQAEEKAQSAEEKMQGMEKAKGKEQDMKLLEAILADLKKQGRVRDEEHEKTILDHLSKISPKDLPHVAALVKETSGKKKEGPMGMPGAEKGPMGMPGMKPGEAAESMMSYSSLGEGENLPPLYQDNSNDEVESLTSKMSRIWDAGR